MRAPAVPGEEDNFSWCCSCCRVSSGGDSNYVSPVWISSGSHLASFLIPHSNKASPGNVCKKIKQTMYVTRANPWQPLDTRAGRLQLPLLQQAACHVQTSDLALVANPPTDYPPACCGDKRSRDREERKAKVREKRMKEACMCFEVKIELYLYLNSFIAPFSFFYCCPSLPSCFTSPLAI